MFQLKTWHFAIIISFVLDQLDMFHVRFIF